MTGRPANGSGKGSAFDALATSWHLRHGRGAARAWARRWRTRRLLAAAPLPPAARVLDVGCGSGEQLVELLPHIGQGVGIDAAAAMVEAARRVAAGGHGRLEFLHLAAERATPERLGRFDLILFVGSLEHMPDPVRALARARELLRPRGRVAIVMPHPLHPRSWLARQQMRRGLIPPFRHLGGRFLRELAAQAGLVPAPVHPAARLGNLLALLLLGSQLQLFTAATPPTREAPTTVP